MKCLLAAFIVLLGPSLAAGQYQEPVELLAGKRIRAKLAGPEGPWAYGFVREAYADSLTMGFPNTRAAIRMRTAEVTVQRANGYDVRRGVVRGAIIGGVATIALMASIPELREEGLHQLLYLIFPPAGAAIGAAVGFGMAPERWLSVSTGTLPCGGWRTVDGNSTGAPIVSRGARNRKRGALIGGLVLGGIGLVGGLADPTFPKEEVPSTVLGNAAVGAVIGSLFGPREKVLIAASCP